MSYFFLSAALTLAAAAAPVPSPEPLKEIGHVKATAACAELALHANTAISSALQNDVLVSQTIQKMRKIDLNTNTIARRNNLQTLGDYAKELRARAVSGDREVQKLREIANKSSDPVQKKELKAFADELGGALYRQKKIANDLNGLLAAFDYHDMKPTAAQLQSYEGGIGAPTMEHPSALVESQTSLRKGSVFNEKHTDTELAGFAAEDFFARQPDITNDEALAANHAEGAVSGC